MMKRKPLVASTLLVPVALCGCSGSVNKSDAAPAALAPATTQEAASLTVEDGGTGSYKAIAVGNATLPGFTIYRPRDLSTFGKSRKLPVVLWGNGAGSNNNAGYKNYLSEIASHGFIVIAIGPYELLVSPSQELERKPTRSAQLLQALDWITAQNKLDGSIYKGKIDVTKVGVFGHSLGGLQAMDISTDPRITTTMMCNSGIFKTLPAGIPADKIPAAHKDILNRLHGPIMYLMGGPSDIAYGNGADDFALITKVPAVWASQDVGHGGTYWAPRGGPYAVATVAWFKWQLQGDAAAATMFAGGDKCGLCQSDPKWKVEAKNLKAR